MPRAARGRRVARSKPAACAAGVSMAVGYASWKQQQQPLSRCGMNEALIGAAAGAVAGCGLHSFLNSEKKAHRPHARP